MTLRTSLFAPAAIVITVISIFGLGYAVTELAEGLTELPRHWWSVLPLVGLFLGALLGITAFRVSKP